MELSARRFSVRPLVSALSTLAVVALLSSFWFHGSTVLLKGQAISATVLTMCLVIGVVLSYQFPIHVRASTKMYMATVPIYLMATLLPPTLAATAVGFAVLAGELLVRDEKGLFYSDIATIASRMGVVTLLGSFVAHVPIGAPSLTVMPLLGAAAVMWAGDILTAPLVFCPITGERPSRVIMATIRSGGVGEGAQYLVGLLGAFVARQQVWSLLLLALPTALVYLAFKRARELRQDTLQLLEGMADTVDMRDPYTGGHSRRVTELVSGILHELGKSGPEAMLIVSAARVHDIGKIGVPDSVLKKTTILTKEERAVMATHAEHGAELLKRYPDFSAGVEMVRHHHERWDGAGYPYRLKGSDIPFGARVIAVADSFDAVTSDRPYRRALTMDRAAAILREGRGLQWDPVIVDALLRSVEDRMGRMPVPLFRIVPDVEEVTLVEDIS